MPKSVVVVHDDRTFVEQVSTALWWSGYDVVNFSDPIATLDALDSGLNADLLITRAQFPTGRPNGISLARMARLKRRSIKILMTGRSHLAEFADGVAEFHAHPVDIRRLVNAAARLLAESDRSNPSFVRIHRRRRSQLFFAFWSSRGSSYCSDALGSVAAEA